ncbi:MAG: peptidylprolyl isomerase [Candidatus Woesearchaeota archaeon]
MAVKKGDKIKVEYTGKLEDGTVFDSSEKHGKPLEFTVGEGKLIKGFDEAVVGMEKDQQKQVKIAPENAYGQKNPQLMSKIPKDQFPADKTPQNGMVVVLSTPEGKQVPAVIAEVGENDVTVDLNHPLAGKTLVFEIKVVEIEA